MRDYAQIAPTFWTRGSGRALRDDPIARLVAIYLMSAPSSNMIGLYYLPIATLAHEVGIPFEGASKALQRVCEAGIAEYDADADLVWLPNMASRQLGDVVKPADNRHKSLVKELAQYGNHPFVHRFIERYGKAYNLEHLKPLSSPSEAPSKALRSQEQEQDQKQEQGIPPTPRGVEADDSNPDWGLGRESGIRPVADPLGGSFVAAAWADGIAAARNGKCSLPDGGNLRALLGAVETHGPKSVGERVLWIRREAEAFARSKPGVVNAFGFRDWLDAGRPAATGTRKTVSVQPVPDDAPWMRPDYDPATRAGGGRQ